MMESNNFMLEGSFTSENLQATKLKTGRLALLDADRVKYIVVDRIYKIKEENKFKGIADIYQKEPLVITETRKWVEEWLSKIDDPILFCFSDSTKNNFRSQICFEKEYKGSRKDKTDYRDYEGKYDDMLAAANFIIENYNSLICSGFEADDIVSFLQDDENTYIISNDKDLKQVSGYHYDESKNEIYYIDPKQALLHLAKQLIQGDSTDDIKGIPGRGEKYAEKFIQNLNVPMRYIMHAVLQEYQNAYNSITKGTEAFCENYFLLKMKTDRGDYFRSKHQNAFDIKEMLLNKIRENK